MSPSDPFPRTPWITNCWKRKEALVNVYTFNYHLSFSPEICMIKKYPKISCLSAIRSIANHEFD